MAINLAKLKETKEKLNKSGGRSEYWKPEDGKNTIRVLPAKSGDEFFVEVHTHYKIGFDEKSVICKKTHEKECPICKELDKLSKGSKKDAELAKDMRAKKAYYLQIVTHDEPDKVKLYPAPKTVFEKIIDILLDPDYGDITDPEEGREITIERSGKGLKTKYTVLPKPKATELEDFDELKEQMVDFTDWEYLKEMSDEDMMKIYYSEEGDEDDDEDESFDDEDESAGYDDMTIDELKALMKKRKLPLPEGKITTLKLITILEHWDEENLEEEEEEDERPKKKKK